MTERASEWVKQGVTDDWDNRERGSDRDEPGYEEDIDSAQANTNHIMNNQQTIHLKRNLLIIPSKTLWKSCKKGGLI